MNDFAPPELEDLSRFLANNGFRSQVLTVGPFARAVLAEDPYALLLVIELHDDGRLREHASDAQAELTRIVAARDDHEKQWDLYVVIHLRTTSITALDLEQVEEVTSDTAYARKLVRVNLRRENAALARAFRPFLAITRVGDVTFDGPLDRLRSLMAANGVPEADLFAAFDLYSKEGRVELP